MIEPIPSDSPKVLGFRLSGKLHDEDYRVFVPAVEQALAVTGGKVSLLVKFEDFHGWDLHAAWDDLKFSIRHFSDFDRIAIIGDQWGEWMARFARPFSQASVKHFSAAEEDAAWAWLRQDG